MIKTRKGTTEANGTISELLADVACIAESIYEKVLLPNLGKEEAKEALQEAFDKGVEAVEKSENGTDKPEGKEEKVEHIENLLRALVSEIMNAIEGDDE